MRLFVFLCALFIKCAVSLARTYPYEFAAGQYQLWLPIEKKVYIGCRASDNEGWRLLNRLSKYRENFGSPGALQLLTECGPIPLTPEEVYYCEYGRYKEVNLPLEIKGWGFPTAQSVQPFTQYQFLLSLHPGECSFYDPNLL